MAEFWRWTAAELSAAYGAGRADPVAVMAELQARIAALNPQINAYVALADDLAAQAEASRRRWQAGSRCRPSTVCRWR